MNEVTLLVHQDVELGLTDADDNLVARLPPLAREDAAPLMCRCDAHHWRRLCTCGRALVRAGTQHHQAREREYYAQTLQAHAELSVSRDLSASEQASTGLTDTADHNVMVRITTAESDMMVMNVTAIVCC